MKKIIFILHIFIVIISSCSGGMGVIQSYRLYTDEVVLNKVIVSKLEAMTKYQPQKEWLVEFNKLQEKAVYFRYYPIFLKDAQQMLMIQVDDKTLYPSDLKHIIKREDTTVSVLSLEYIVIKNKFKGNFEYIGYDDLNEQESKSIVKKFEQIFLNKLGIRYKRLRKIYNGDRFYTIDTIPEDRVLK